MQVQIRITEHPKMFLRAAYESGAGRMKVKVEVNTYERAPANTPSRIPFQLKSSWFTGSADVLTFTVDEVVATKIRDRFSGRRDATCLTSGWHSLNSTFPHPRLWMPSAHTALTGTPGDGPS